MRMLFFPSDLGGGFGHISRCLALAQEGKHRGHDCAFVINDMKYDQKIKNDFNVFFARKFTGWSSLISVVKNNMMGLKSPLTPIFTEFSGLDYQVVRDGLVTERIINRELANYIKIVKVFKPDVLIGDTNLLVWMLSKKTDVPVVQVVRYASHPKTANLIWWKNEPQGMIPPDSPKLFNPLLLRMGLRPIKNAADLLQGNLFIVPSIREIEPIPEDRKTVHVGELTISTKDTEIPSWLQAVDNHHPFIYITIGGGAGPVGNKSLFSTIIESFENKPIQVVVSTSGKFDASSFPTPPKNVRFFKWVPGKIVISEADLVIFHGGYGTMMESITCGKPTITIPYQSEQEGNGRRLEQLGCGRVLKLSREKYKKIETKWRHGAYSFFVQNKYDLTAEKLSEEVEKLLYRPQFKLRAQSLQESVKKYCGPETSMELIEKYWS